MKYIKRIFESSSINTNIETAILQLMVESIHIDTEDQFENNTDTPTYIDEFNKILQNKYKVEDPDDVDIEKLLSEITKEDSDRILKLHKQFINEYSKIPSSEEIDNLLQAIKDDYDISIDKHRTYALSANKYVWKISLPYSDLILTSNTNMSYDLGQITYNKINLEEYISFLKELEHLKFNISNKYTMIVLQSDALGEFTLHIS